MQRYRSDTEWMSSSGLRAKLAWHLRYRMIIQLLFSLSKPITVVAPSIMLKLLLDSLSGHQSNNEASISRPMHVIFMLAMFVPLCQLVGTIAEAQATIFAERFATTVRTLIQAEIFSKALRRSDNHTKNLIGVKKTKATQGKIQNIFTSDTSDG